MSKTYFLCDELWKLIKTIVSKNLMPEQYTRCSKMSVCIQDTEQSLTLRIFIMMLRSQITFKEN